MNCQYETKYRKFLWWRIPYKSKRSSVYTGNATRHFDSLNGKSKGSVQVSAGSWGDPAYGCGKKFNASYNCGWGTNSKSINLSQEANGKMANLDCTDLPCADKTPYKLVMQDDGNLVLYDKANESIWASNTAGKVGDPFVFYPIKGVCIDRTFVVHNHDFGIGTFQKFFNHMAADKSSSACN